jgi:hypothetical protein
MLRSRVAREDGDTSRVRPSDSKRWGRLPASAVSNQPHFMATTFYGRPHFYGRSVLGARHTHTARIHADTQHTHTHSIRTYGHTRRQPNAATCFRSSTSALLRDDVRLSELMILYAMNLSAGTCAAFDSFIGWGKLPLIVLSAGAGGSASYDHTAAGRRSRRSNP